MWLSNVNNCSELSKNCLYISNRYHMITFMLGDGLVLKYFLTTNVKSVTVQIIAKTL